MPDPHIQWHQLATRWFRSTKNVLLVAAVAFALLVLWAAPRRVLQVISIGEDFRWNETNAPQRRQVVWQPAEPLEGLLQGDLANADILSPRLAEGGSLLLCTVRHTNGQMDLFSSRFSDGQWQPVQPLKTLNSPAQDIGATISADGRWLWFYSNRAGGFGGFDLYVSKWQSGQWQPPQNLGVSINTAAHESEPAISPDGNTLYFSSNRTAAMQREKSGPESTATQRPWSGTLRSELGESYRGLYRATRTAPQQPWEHVEPVTSLNRADSDEGSPYLSPDNGFLYFSSNRARSPDQTRHFELYRARQTSSGFQTPETLGTSINSLNDELEPALSPEGFTLVFSSDRSGRNRIYRSRAIEVFTEPGWDTAHLGILAKVWLPALLLTLLAAALVAVWMWLRGWFWEAATSMRFFGASLIFHAVALFVLAFWSLPTVVTLIVSNLQESEAAEQPFADNQHQSHEDGQQAWEKLHDLKAEQKTIEVTRSESTPLNMPQPTENLEPTISIEMAQRLPTDRVLYSPPPQPVDTPEPAPSPARATAPAKATVEVRDDMELIEPTETPAIAQNQVTPADLPRRAPPSRILPDQPTEVAELTPMRTLDTPAAELPDAPTIVDVEQVPPANRDRSELARQLIELVEDPSAPVVPIDDRNAQPQPTKPIDRLTRTAPKPAAAPTVQSSAELPVRTMRPATTAATVPTAGARPQPRSIRLRRAGAVAPTIPDLEEAALAADLPDPVAAPTAQNAMAVKVELNRSAVVPPRIEVVTPRIMGGPSRRNQRISTGQNSDVRRELPPTFGPIVSQLERRHAKATQVVYAADSVGLQEMFTLRQADIRRQHIKLFGGTDESEVAVNQGLAWLAAHQNKDGSWSLNTFHVNCQGKHPNCGGAGKVRSNTAATGLALLPFLAAGNTHQAGEYQQNIARAIGWLQKQQKPNGDLLSAGDASHIYSHSIASIAVCETFGMTQDPALKPLAEKSLQFLIKAQHGPTGGWRYSPNQAGDTSVVGWAMMALKSGEMAGLTIPQATLDLVAKWLSSVEGNKPNGGHFGYQNGSATPAMTAEGLLCLQFMGVARNQLRMRSGADYLLLNLPDTDQRRTSYYWYYGTQVMYHMQGRYWEAWNGRLRDHLTKTQISEGPLSGTWNPRDNWEASGGRIYATAIKLLMLEVYYRHLPLYEQLDE